MSRAMCALRLYLLVASLTVFGNTYAANTKTH